MTGALARLLTEALHGDGQILDATGQATPFERLRDEARLVAQSLASEGLQPGEPVHVVVANRAGDIAALLGIWRAGGVAVPMHGGALPETRTRAQRLTGTRFVVDGGALTAVATQPPPERTLLRGAALIVFTSGSTGQPKGVVLSHDALKAKLDVLDALLGVGSGDTVVLPLQMTFIFGIWASLLALRARATLLLVAKFSPLTLAPLLAGPATVLAAVPSMLRTLGIEAVIGPPGPRLLLTGGEALGPDLRQTLARAWPGVDIRDLYGLTETGSCDFCAHVGDTGAEADSIGHPTDQVAFRLMTVEGTEALQGDSGELQIRSPFGMAGYLDDEPLTESSFENGYFRTGDIARRRPDGCVELVGRSKEIISRGGNKIAPQEIDNLLASHPDVAAALCAGVPDTRLGEALHAVIVLNRGATLTCDALRAWAATRIERYKLPDVITIADALPLGPTGKTSRALLRAQALQPSE